MKRLKSVQSQVSVLLMWMTLFVGYGQEGAQVTVPADLVLYPELIVYNGRIVTMDDYQINNSVGTIVQGMAVRGGKVWKLGSNNQVLAYAGPETTRIDVGGKTIIPGLVNVHTHMHDYALSDWVDANPDNLAVRVFRVQGETVDEVGRNLRVLMKERTSGIPAGQWIFFYLPNPRFSVGGGPGFDFLMKKTINAQQIDRLVPDNPVILAAHPIYIINTSAMEALKEIYRGQPSPENWGEDGYTPGLGVEYRRQVVVDAYFNDKTSELKEIIYNGLLGNVAAGFTTFSSHIMGIQNFDAYMQLYRAKRMPIRFAFTHYAGFAVNDDPVGFYRRLGDMLGLGDDYFWFAGVGAGYIDSGPPLFCTNMVPSDDKDMYEWCRNAPGTLLYETMVTILANGGRVVAGHNYGDKSADYFMDAIEEAMSRNSEITLEHIRSLRLSSDHGGLYPRPDQLPRIKKLGMILSMGSQSMSRSLPWIEKYGFEKYQNWVVPVKRTLAAGIKVAWEGEGGYKDGAFSMIAPFITRRNKQGKLVAPDQALDRNTVLKMATAWGSEFLLKEDLLGSLEPGKLADFLVLNQDYFTVPVEQIERTYPVMTVLGGKILFVREEFAKTLGVAPVGRQIRYSWEK